MACVEPTKNGFEEASSEIATLQRLEMEPENFRRGSPRRNRHSPVAMRNSPVRRGSNRRVFSEEVLGGIAILRSFPHLAIIILKGTMDEPENRWASLCNIVVGPRGLTGTLRRLPRDLCGPHFLIQGVVTKNSWFRMAFDSQIYT